MKKYKVILISGGFDPVHRGHIECIQNAQNLAEQVWIGLNNDKWLRNKKGKSFMEERERAFVMDNIKGVDWVYIMNPKDHQDTTAVDFIDARSDPASGSVIATARIESPVTQPGSHFSFCSSLPKLCI